MSGRIHIETLQEPGDYPKPQLAEAEAVCREIRDLFPLVGPHGRGRFVLCEDPADPPTAA